MRLNGRLIRAGMAFFVFAAVCSADTLHLDDLATPGHFPPRHPDPGYQKPEEVIYKTAGGENLKLYVFNPRDHEQDQQRPAILLIHGGGWMSGQPSFFFPHARYFASRGMVAISVQYRLGGEAPGGIFGCLADCKSAMRYLRNHADSFGIDPDRIAVAGDSAGGHLAAALGLFDGFNDPENDLSVSARPNAMLLYNPVLDLVDLKWTRRHPGIRKPGEMKDWDEDPVRVHKHGETPVDRARAFSPNFNIEPDQPPALLMNGTDDKTTPVEHARRFAKLYVDEGNRCDLVVLEEVAHACVLINYTAEEEVVVRAIREGDKFLESLGYLEGDPTLEVNDDRRDEQETSHEK